MAFALFLSAGCNITKNIPEGQYLLQNNTIKLHSEYTIPNKSEYTDNLSQLVVQKPNTRFFGIPFKLIFYNARYKKFSNDSTNYQLKSKTVEPPVIFDSSTIPRSKENMRSYMFNQGYFYAQVDDTVKFKGKKAYPVYDVQAGFNYQINETRLRVDDDDIKNLLKKHADETVLTKGKPFSMSLLDVERSRIIDLLKNDGFFLFSQEFISFEIDTGNKFFLKPNATPLANALSIISLQAENKEPTINIITIINTEDAPDAASRYAIQNVTVFPDFIDREDAEKNKFLETSFQGVKFRYHNYYLKENVIYQHIALEANKLYTQNDYEATITRLNSLGVFQTVRVVLIDDTSKRPAHYLNMYVLLSAAKKKDFGTSFEVSNGTTYVLGSALTLSYRDKNLFKGANLLSTSASVGLESDYNQRYGDNFFSNFRLLTKNFGVNASIDFPKFLIPVSQQKFSKKNLPRTVIGIGTSLLDRVNFFTLSNSTANITYNWKETSQKNWAATPVFINVIKLPNISDSFQKRLDQNSFLRNSYRELFIEGENITFTFSNQIEKQGRSYSYAKFAIEEAGGLLSGVSSIAGRKNSERQFPFAQYAKFDYDMRHYFNRLHSQTAFRVNGGVGLPYGFSPNLPYIKQYFVGGPYSIRGWRIRSLGPGSYQDSTVASNVPTIDRTGDIKIELNAEYRFDVVSLFGGSVKIKGAVFTDAGNIWLSQPDDNYPGGEFRFNKLGKDIAISTGAGARFDLAGFFILRLDAAFPIKKPYVSTNGGFVFNQIDFGSAQWRATNLILNFAIGYPF